MSEQNSYILQLLKRTKFLIGIGVVVGVIAIIVSLLFPLKYSATGSLLIIPRQGFGVDPYTVIKSAERVGENLSQIVETSSFLSQVLESDLRIVSKVFPKDENKRRKYWKQTIDPQVSPGTGLLRVTAYSVDGRQAEIISDAVINTLVENGVEYVGPQVEFKAVEKAVVSNFPVKPNLIANAIVGFLFGLILASLRVLFKKEKKLSKDQVYFG